MGSQPGRLADDVYRQLRDDIVVGRLRPREPLVEVDLAERLRVSRTPVRESLQRLANDGLIDSHRRRWVVHEHTLQEIKDIYEVRMALEGFAARLACQRASEEEVESLIDFAATHALFEPGDARFTDFNTELHEMVTRMAHNTSFEQLAASGRFFAFNSRLAMGYTAADLRESQEQHAAIVSAIAQRDPDAAERAARAHVELSLRLIVAWWR